MGETEGTLERREFVFLMKPRNAVSYFKMQLMVNGPAEFGGLQLNNN